ncbi:uncharacterized protein LOC106659400 [Trichogramma pretiosum]|uniref:uncharacterized protein LOC106659400 n=1 Tax=Trichogramma pretiosum TaxID=7493 RepID=UPI0006C99055|nr:uncharacterized protein LOC106659400 [Trichogramma pretiosum]
MDWTLGTDQSLQDMLDCDIKTEIDSVIGGHPELGFNFTDLSPLELDDDPIHSHVDLNNWFTSQSLINGNSNSSNSNFNLDLNSCDAASVMVNPNSVMPFSSARGFLSQSITSPSEKQVNNSRALSTSNTPDISSTTSAVNSSCLNTPRRHFVFTSNMKKNHDILEQKHAIVNTLKKEISETNEFSDRDHNIESSDSEVDEASEDEDLDDKNKFTLKICSKNIKTSSVSSKSLTLVPLKMQKSCQQQPSNKDNISTIKLQNLKLYQSSNLLPTQRQKIYDREIESGSIILQHKNIDNSLNLNCTNTNTQFDSVTLEYDSKPFPKPAYSYSCLIAMALKNSQTGSLPVSEIYNFMCEHFPYFKTAPNGWKNSVRHNLSLNKCFEKIEKPAGNGNQRKGCLWAINPAKVAKMDEEVLKWSRKDPLAIKKAMIYPEQLELLERGEMKYVSNNGFGGDFSTEETESSGDEGDISDQTISQQTISLVPAKTLHMTNRLAANSISDSYDESSQDIDLDINDQIQDEIDIVRNEKSLHMQINIGETNSIKNNLDYLNRKNTKRQKINLTETLQANFVYQTVNPTLHRKSSPLFLTTSSATGSFVKLD